MAHMVAKEVYRKLGRKIDGLSVRAPWNETLNKILRELYSPEEADLVARMPYGLASLDKIVEITGYEITQLRKILDVLCSKGLVMDMYLGGQYHYIPSPLVVGIFELTMMRTGGGLNTKEWARLFHEYMQDKNTFHRANFGKGQRVSPLRTLPHEQAMDESGWVEVLDYEKATAIVEKAKKIAVGICSCRHEKLHADAKTCDIPLETCTTFDGSAVVLIKRNMAREVSRTEALELFARSREAGLVFNADNVQKDVAFICHCCKCCCNMLLGVSKFGYPNALVTSSFIARRDSEICSECGTCVESCPIEAISADSGSDLVIGKVDESICIGCGVCALNCPTGAMKLHKRDQKVLHPEDTFERIVLQCLERGTLQNQMFSNPQSIGQKFMRGVVGAFYRLPPVKKALMTDALRSSFLNMMRNRT